MDLGEALGRVEPARVVAPLQSLPGGPLWVRLVERGLREGWLSCNDSPPEGPLRFYTLGGQLRPHRPPRSGGSQPLGALLVQGLLEPLDRWGAEQMQRHHRGQRRRQNPTYTRLLHLLKTLQRRGWDRLPAATPSGRHPYGPTEVGCTGWDLRRRL